MPSKPKKPCSYPGCPNLVIGRYCDKHQKDDQKQQDERRGSAHARGYDARWRRYRIQYLNANPLCVYCAKDGRVVAATVVDHIKPHKGDRSLFWDSSNHQSLCKRCHDVKTAAEDGGFGNGR